MGIASRYWTLVCLRGSGGSKTIIIESAQAFFLEHFDFSQGTDEVHDADIQLQLWQSFHLESEAASPAEWCLRCFISHTIEKECTRLERAWGERHGLRRDELLPCVLEDYYHRGNSKRSQQTQAYQTLADRILQTFDPQKGSLSTWATLLVRNDRRLNALLLEHEIYLVSDWAILSDTTLQQLTKSLSEFHGLTSKEVEEAILLLQSYHAVYRSDRRQRSPRSTKLCLDPSSSQLRLMGLSLGWEEPDLTDQLHQILASLRTLASKMREHRISKRCKGLSQTSLDAYQERHSPIAAPMEDTQQSEQNIFLERWDQQYELSLDQAIHTTIEKRLAVLNRRQPDKAKIFLEALYLFHCARQGMGEIAVQVDLKAQYEVSRLLKLKALRLEVQRETLVLLKERLLEMAATYTDPSRLQTLNTELEAFLEQQITETMVEAATEASTPSQHTVRSFFSKRLCHHLDQRPKS